MTVYRIAHGSCEIYLARLEERLQDRRDYRRQVTRNAAGVLAAAALFVALALLC